MSEVSGSDQPSSGAEPDRTTQLTLKIWHPNCWTLETTAACDAGLIAHSVHEYDGLVNARLTAYADQQCQIETLVEDIQGSSQTAQVKRIHNYLNPSLRTEAAGNTTEELLVRYPPVNSIHDPLLSRGFIPDEEIRIHDGYEYWTVIVADSRSAIQTRLEEIRDELNAEIDVLGMKAAGRDASGPSQTEGLSERQREVFELARQQGYYAWPRGSSATELASELGVTKSTVLEHLRKAEAKLLDPDD